MKVSRDFYENILDQNVKKVLPFMEMLQFI